MDRRIAINFFANRGFAVPVARATSQIPGRPGGRRLAVFAPALSAGARPKLGRNLPLALTVARPGWATQIQIANP